MFPPSNSPSRPARSARRHRLALLALLATTAGYAADIRISDLTDIDFGIVPPTAGQLVSTMDFCVSLDMNGQYGVVARGTGVARAFTLNNGVSNLPYALRYSDNPGQPGTLMTPGFPEWGFRAKKRKKNEDCNKPSASIEVTIEAADLQAASAGQYFGQLVLTVTPE